MSTNPTNMFLQWRQCHCLLMDKFFYTAIKTSQKWKIQLFLFVFGLFYYFFIEKNPKVWKKKKWTSVFIAFLKVLYPRRKDEYTDNVNIASIILFGLNSGKWQQARMGYSWELHNTNWGTAMWVPKCMFHII